MGDDNETLTSQEIMANLDDKERDRFVKFQETFESAGWPLIVEIARGSAFAHGVQGANAKTWEECVENRGARRVWELIETFADTYMNAFEQSARSAIEAAKAAEAEDHE